MFTRETLTWFGVAVEFASAIYYLYTIPKGKTRPQPLSWLGWSVVGALATWISHREGANQAVYINASFLVVTSSIFVASVVLHFRRKKKEEDPANPTDIPVMIIAAGLLIPWALQIGPSWFYATAACLADICFVWFTIDHVRHAPDEENLWAWCGAVVAAVIGVAVLGSHSYSASIFSYYLVVANLAIAGTLAVYQRRLHRA